MKKFCEAIIIAFTLIIWFSILVYASGIRSAGVAGNLPDVNGTNLARQVIKKLGEKPKVWILFAHDKSKSKNVKLPNNYISR